MNSIFKDLVKGIGYGIVFIMLCSILDFVLHKI